MGARGPSRPCLLPLSAYPPSLSTPSPLSRGGEGRPSGPHESGAAAGGLNHGLRADRVTRAPSPASKGVGGVAFGGPVVGLPGPGLRSARPRGTQQSLPRVREPPRAPFPGRAAPRHTNIRLRPQIRRDNPLNLSILLSGGKETNQDSLSSGERRGTSSVPNPGPTGGPGNFGVWKTARPVSLGGLSPSDRGSARGRCEAGNGPRRAGVRSSRSRVVWECSPKRVVNSI